MAELTVEVNEEGLAGRPDCNGARPVLVAVLVSELLGLTLFGRGRVVCHGHDLRTLKGDVSIARIKNDD